MYNYNDLRNQIIDDTFAIIDIWGTDNSLIGKQELWTNITEYNVPNIKYGYYISNYGRAYSTLSNSFLTPVITENGYYRISLYDTVKKVSLYHLLHRIVMIAFNPISNFNNMQVNHKDGNKSHNWIWNLEWVTCKENIHHAISNNLRNNEGENHPMHIISECTADKIGELLSSTNMTALEIANFVGNGVTERIVYNIRNGTAWRNVYNKYNLEIINRNPRVTDNNTIHSICEYFELYRRENPIKRFGERKDILLNALQYANLEANESTIRLAERLYYRLTHIDICSMYDY